MTIMTMISKMSEGLGRTCANNYWHLTCHVITVVKTIFLY